MCIRDRYQSNPLVPDYAWYPGLTAITVDFHELSGMSVFGSAAIIVGVIKVWGAVALLGIFVKTMGDWRYATLATLLYFANPSYMQFDSQFFYESVALSLMFVIIWILLIAVDKADSINVVLPGLLCTCLTITHHLTAYCLVLLLAGCVFAGRLRGKRRYDDTTRRREDQMGPVSVSYTHLDVYKRQGAGWVQVPRPDATRRNASCGKRLFAYGITKHQRRCLLYTSRCV